jgi:hypothetical protein
MTLPGIGRLGVLALAWSAHAAPDTAMAATDVADLADVGRRLLGRRIAVVPRDREPPGVRLALVAEHGLKQSPCAWSSANRMRLLTDGRTVAQERGGGLGGFSKSSRS